MLGKNIKHFRIHNNYTQEGLAKVLGVDKRTISAWECGRQFPEHKYILEMMNTFMISEYDFFCRMDVQDSLSRTIDKLHQLDEHHQFEVMALISKLHKEEGKD